MQEIKDQYGNDAFYIQYGTGMLLSLIHIFFDSDVIGRDNARIINNLTVDIVNNSYRKERICMSEACLLYTSCTEAAALSLASPSASTPRTARRRPAAGPRSSPRARNWDPGIL